jgi:hypothetical protein
VRPRRRLGQRSRGARVRAIARNRDRTSCGSIARLRSECGRDPRRCRRAAVRPGGACILAYGPSSDRIVYCRVSPAKKKNVRAALQVNGGAAAVAQ